MPERLVKKPEGGEDLVNGFLVDLFFCFFGIRDVGDQIVVEVVFGWIEHQVVHKYSQTLTGVTPGPRFCVKFFRCLKA